ncbi:MAG: succinyl-diaminopimelate desuccinylase [Phenylobacterium sp.]|uniref:succinyl-diaminopimelate desuccinylase n=1 Tax=Phenylobacterium sp. TaxID=1871053 RepID=UPI00271C36C3|nr:succinyl-diaminopimelate desuccinylase [Phenylobacterium sp.]MDO9246212.1 succinyl-diaminopimelate desuccinylase [Phenylobacterium sp.]MDP2012565.1 succinyl-diaminopimelate desuccinylase [Phenylobacterium sp.]MDP3631798.1 succinyl-diaminopimelate desuccinylase [Phenylobacterium sp.]MDP3870999.1 succinyl-diaminopimelate desuccinylase [Phenylobacterium sp.]
MSIATQIDPVALTQDLIRRPSVTPADAGAMDIVQQTLQGLGFACRRMKFGEIENLYARYGTASPNLCFAGHTDVVPVGDAAAWSSEAFAAEIIDGVLIGRGSVDMKSGVAAFAAACAKAIAAGQVAGSLSFLITGDEEGIATHGTKMVVQALKAEGEIIDHCVVGEPSSAETFGDMIKIGRRGSINVEIVVEGVQGHVAYPHRAANPVPVLVALLHRLAETELDTGFLGFQPSNLEVTTVDVGNATTNLIPAAAKARLNIRFNPNHTGQSLADWIEGEAREALAGFQGNIVVTPSISGEAFLTEPGPFTDVVAAAVADITGKGPELSTTGGTSDARFIRALCPVVELGLVGKTMHAVDERAPVEEIRQLQAVYERLIERYFQAFKA